MNKQCPKSIKKTCNRVIVKDGVKYCTVYEVPVEELNYKCEEE